MLAGLLAGLLWSISREAWVGIGGKMGTVALAGVLTAYAVAALVGEAGSSTKPPATSGAVAGVLAVAAVAATVTWLLAWRARWGPVLGSSVSTGLFALVLLALPGLAFGHADLLTIAWFSASFVGMTAPARVEGKLFLVPLAGVVCGALLIAFGSNLSGMGGIAGATALIAVFATRGALAAFNGARGAVPSAQEPDGERHLTTA